MKKITKFVAMCLTGALALGFTACSNDDDDENVIHYGEDMKAVVSNYVDAVVEPTYKELAVKADALYNACQNLKTKRQNGTLTQADIDAACTAFKEARKYWEQSEAFLYGAASDNEIDPHIDSWPLDHDQLKNALTNNNIITGINGATPTKFVYEHNKDFDSVLGFHGLEFMLFRNGQNRTLAAFNATYETEPGLTTVKTVDEAAFAAAVAGDLRNMIYLLEYAWLGNNGNAAHKTYLFNNARWTVDGTRYQGLSPKNSPYGEFVKNAGEAGMFTTWHETLSNVFIGGCSSICEEVASQKLGQAYRKATGTGTAEDAADYIESPYSKRSFQDYQDNIYSIKNSLYGVRGTENVTTPANNSVMKFLQKSNYPKYAELNNALNDAINALQTAKTSGVAFIDNPGHAQVKTCIEKVDALNEALQEAGKWVSGLAD